MPNVECIHRNPVLAQRLEMIMRERRLGVRQLAREAGVSFPMVSSMLHPESRYASNVSEERGADIIAAAARTLEERIELLLLGGVTLYIIKGEGESPDQVVQLFHAGRKLPSRSSKPL